MRAFPRPAILKKTNLFDVREFLLLYCDQNRNRAGRMNNESNDRRGFVRIPFKTDVKIDSGSRHISINSEIDVSMSGLRVSFRGAALDAGAPCRISIILRGLGNQVTIGAAGKVVRSGPGTLAVEFTEIDLASYDHLRLLILNNTGDPEKAEQQFRAHWGIRKASL